MYKHIIFDFDGTLVNSENTIKKVVKELMNEHSFKIDYEIDFNKIREISLWKKAKLIFFLTLVRKKFEKRYHDEIEKVKMFDKMESIISKLNECGYHLSIISMNSKDTINNYFDTKGLSIFKHILSAQGYTKFKPIKNYLKKNKLNRDEVVYLGDEIGDIKACRKNNIDIISVTWGLNSKEKLMKGNPTYIADTPEEIISILEKNNII